MKKEKEEVEGGTSPKSKTINKDNTSENRKSTKQNKEAKGRGGRGALASPKSKTVH